MQIISSIKIAVKTKILRASIYRLTTKVEKRRMTTQEENTNTQNQEQEEINEAEKVQPLGFVKMPFAVLRAAGLSDRAKSTYALAVAYAKGDNTTIWLRHVTLAEELNCSIASVQRAIVELTEQGFLKKLNQRFQGRYPYFEFKKYWSEKAEKPEDAGKPSVTGDAGSQAPTHAENESDRVRQASVPEDTPHQRPPLVRKDNKNNIYKKQQQHQVELPTGLVAEQMILVGLKPDVVAELIENCGLETCERQLKNLASQKEPPYNPAGWLKKAIEDGYNYQIGGKSQAEAKASEENEKLRKESYEAAKKAYDDEKPREALKLLKGFNDDRSSLLRLNAQGKVKEIRKQERFANIESKLSDCEKGRFRDRASQLARGRYGDTMGPILEAATTNEYNTLLETAARNGEVANA